MSLLLNPVVLTQGTPGLAWLKPPSHWVAQIAGTECRYGTQAEYA